MSSPLPQFNKLSIQQTMQSSRATPHGQLAGKGKGKAPAPRDITPVLEEEEDDDEDDEEEEEEDEEDPERIFALDHCRQHNECYAFQIAYAEPERYSIRINPTNLGVRRAPTCTCPSGHLGTCRHIHWLLEQLSRAGADVVGGTDIGPYERITAMGLGNVCYQLQWELRDADWDSEETIWELKKHRPAIQASRQTRGMMRDRMAAVRDIMAALSHVVTEDYRKDIFESPTDFTTGEIYVPADLEATLSRLLILDDDVFRRMNSSVPSNERALGYFRKIIIKAENTCALLDNYLMVGPAAGQHDLIWCAQTLSNIVDSIHRNITERQPLSPLSRAAAAKALVTILGMVVERNKEVYNDLSWQRRRPHGEPAIDRNLYLRLIGSLSNANPPINPTFALEALQDLPEAKRYVEDLEEILAKLESIGWGPAPLAYRNKLTDIIVQLKGRPSPSTSGGKRGASSVDRKVKRMK
ncbi:hypothetical protein G7Y89_g1992 [Cudoniella acicularis]|uniref:SWIM-type domain-containing protein n=1 Tax=Cudoniella acicularis TaxID=354080 RepID=A0A8H4W7D8_9HELO|nr:hypothetical protein G7Y89_g1992 [Cudoniella acicularis]